MDIEIVEGSTADLSGYGDVSIGYLVETRFRVEPVCSGIGGWRLTEEPVEPPFFKDYDQDGSGGPARSLERSDTSNWGVFAAFYGSRRVGGVLVVWKTPDAHMLEGREDIACIWDIRVRPEDRRQGWAKDCWAALPNGRGKGVVAI